MLAQVVEHLPDGDAGDRIEAGGGLVEKEDLRIVDQAAGNLQAAAHSAGEGLGLRAAPLGQVHGFKHFGRCSSRARPWERCRAWRRC